MNFPDAPAPQPPRWSPAQNGRADLRQRVHAAAAAVLERENRMGPLELLAQMRFLPGSHFRAWRTGQPHFRILESHFQVGTAKLKRALEYFQEWLAQGRMKPLESPYTIQTREGIQRLQITTEGMPEAEKFYCTSYLRADLSPQKTAKVAAKAVKPPELVVFQKVTEEGQCSECGVELGQGNFLRMEKGKPVCLGCADLDHLVFLAAGDAALSRRARQRSVLSAVVVRFSRSRKRYERQGVLVTAEALEQAQAQCAADAPARQAARLRAAAQRQAADREFVAAFAEAIRQHYPQCPTDEAGRIARHAGQRSSGRVGRSAAGRRGSGRHRPPPAPAHAL